MKLVGYNETDKWNVGDGINCPRTLPIRKNTSTFLDHFHYFIWGKSKAGYCIRSTFTFDDSSKYIIGVFGFQGNGEFICLFAFFPVN